MGTSGVGVTQLRPSKFITIGRLEGLDADMVWSVRQSIDGSLLIGTNHGFSRWKDGAMTSLTVREGLSSDDVRSVMEDRSGGIWLGTSDGVNLYQHGKVTVYRTSNGLPDNTVRTATEDRQGNIWIGTRGGGLARYRDGVFKVFNKANGLAGDLVVSMNEDRDGSIWIASDGGVSVLKNGAFTNYGVRDGLSTNSVRVIHHDHQGGHWIGTYGGGLNRIKNGHISRISVKDGLFDEVVFAIVEDRSGYLWMTCNRGVFRVSIRELNDFADGRIKRVHSTSFDITDGMKAAECNGGSPGAWEGRDGRLFFATIKGVAIIDPNHMALNTLAPPVWNEEVLVNGKTENVSPAGLTISPGRHSLEIHYTALSFVVPRSVRFRYRLRGFSDSWVDAGNRRTAFYTNLPPGNYSFEVMGSNNDGVWSTASNPLRFQFQAAFFQTVAFKLLCGLGLILAVRGVFHVRLKFLQERERVLVKRVDEQTAELMAAKTAAESVAETNTRLRLKNELILNSIADGVYVVDPSGTISLENPAASRMLGWEGSSLVGRPAHATTHHSTLGGPYPVDDCPIYRTLADGVLRQVSDEVFWRKDGTPFPVHYLAAPILDSKERVTGVAVTFRDITELKAVEQLKSEFVSTVSHELRTPLTSIRGALGLLGSGLLGPIAEKGQRMLEIAVTNTDRLVRLINDILDLERMTAGKTEMRRVYVDTTTILVQATEGLQSIADEAEVRIVVKPGTGALWGDSDRIMQTLTNLLANAIKFSRAKRRSPSAGQHTKRSSSSASPTRDEACPRRNSRPSSSASARSTAPIPATKAAQASAWPSAKASSPRTVAASGWKRTIPPGAASNSRSRWQKRKGSMPPKQILIIDDENDIQEVARLSLQLTENWSVISANGGAAGTLLALSSEPDAILLDVMMPDMDGPSTLRVLQRQGNTVPVIFLTAKVQPPTARNSCSSE